MNPQAKLVKLEAGIDRNARHIFRQALGHFPHDTPAIRQLLVETVADSSFYLGQDKYETDWYAQTLPNGEQVWVQVRQGEIRNAGINPTARVWQPDTGLAGSS